MIVAPPPDNEPERLEALVACHILDTPADPRFDDLAALAAQICQTPIALVVLVDTHRQWFKAKVGVTACETPRDWAFCAHALHEQDILVVPDAIEDERFVTNPLVTGDPNIRFYAGVPLRTNKGLALGTLCVIDRVPRELDQEQLRTLHMLARQVLSQLELHRRVHEQENVITRQEHRLLLELENKRHQEFFELIVEAAPSGMIMVDQHGTMVLANQLITQQFGYSQEELVGQPIEMLIPKRFHMAHSAHRNSFFDSPRTHRMGEGRDLYGLRKDKSEFPVEIDLNPLDTPKGMFVLSSIVDVSERKQAEAEKDRLNKELVDISRRAGMADVATGVLHNVGNVLNSVNVAAGVVVNTLRRSSLDKVTRTAELIQANLHDVGRYLTQDPKGQQIPDYLNKLGQQLTYEQEMVMGELKGLVKNIEHIKEIVSVQQTVAKSCSLEEPVVIEELMQQALIVNQDSLDAFNIEVVKEYMEIPEVVVDKHQVLQVLVNLVGNAKYAMKDLSDGPRRLTVRILEIEEEDISWIKLEVSDTGVGIPPENLKRMFTQGFTTKKDGHGFGLHSGALSAKLMGGALTVCSDGEGQGATFTLTLQAKRREVSVG